MKKICLFVIILGLIVGGYWAYKHHWGRTIICYITTPIKGQIDSAMPSTPGNGYIHSHEGEKFLNFIKQDAPSGIIIFVKNNDVTGQEICGDQRRHHKIIVVNKQNPYLNELSKWGINASKIRAPYTIIIQHGNVIIRSSGTLCSY